MARPRERCHERGCARCGEEDTQRHAFRDGRTFARRRVVSRLFVLVFVLLAFRIGAAEAMEIERVVSPGGIEAWLVEEPSIPVIVMEAAWKGGTATDPAEKAGLANMVSGLLDEGAGGLTSAEFQERLDDIAAKMSFSA